MTPVASPCWYLSALWKDLGAAEPAQHAAEPALVAPEQDLAAAGGLLRQPAQARVEM